MNNLYQRNPCSLSVEKVSKGWEAAMKLKILQLVSEGDVGQARGKHIPRARSVIPVMNTLRVLLKSLDPHIFPGVRALFTLHTMWGRQSSKQLVTASASSKLAVA